MRRPIPDIRALLARLFYVLTESAHYSRYSAPMVGIIGVFGFPAYYYVWAYLIPQPYENFWLRLVGTLLCVPLALHRFWPRQLTPYFVPYWLFSVGYILPFFFTYMLLKNDLSLVWSMSTMCALFLLVLALHHWVPVVITFIIGSLAAWALFLLSNDSLLAATAYLGQLPVYLFVSIAGCFFNYTTQMVKDEKLKTYAAVGRNIAHELRTPLLGMKGSANALQRYLPELVQTYRAARAANIPVQPIRDSRLDQLSQAADRINDEIDYSNIIIDMLLFSAGQKNLSTQSHEIHSAASTVDNALRRFPFKSEQEKALVRVETHRDFTYNGSELLVTHALFNLLKNALYSVLKARKGDIIISINSDGKRNTISVKDAGLGIPEKEQQYIFKHFYSSKSVEEGSGIGLSFCKAVMDGLGGKIHFRSKPGEFSEFTMIFPEH